MDTTPLKAKREGQCFSGIRGSAPLAKGMQFFADLAAITNVSEASELWCVPVSTLLRWCNEGKVAAIKPGGRGGWVISVRSMISRCGQPKLTTEENSLDLPV